MNTAMLFSPSMNSSQQSGISNAATTAAPQLERGLGLKEAVALNMIEIVGIGPFVVSSLVIKAMGGPQALNRVACWCAVGHARWLRMVRAWRSHA